MKDKIRVLVAEDHLIARVGVISIINVQPDMTVVAEAVNGQEVVEQFRKYRPDVTLLDIRMPDMSGVETATLIRAEFPDARLIALTSYDGDENMRRAIAAGVRAYLTKDVRHEELLNTIRAVHAGEVRIPAALLNPQLPPSHLSTREVQVLELVAAGRSNKQIAYELDIAENTVRIHVRNILGKLRAQDRTGAATTAIQRGIITL
jgi:DNA-binding NarL/FixJ family response regulator